MKAQWLTDFPSRVVELRAKRLIKFLIPDLSQLAECKKTRGELGIEGYRLVSNFISELGSQGIGQEEALSELRYLLNH